MQFPPAVAVNQPRALLDRDIALPIATSRSRSRRPAVFASPSGRLEFALAACAFVVIAVIALAHARQYRGFIADDALISLRYARRLVEGQGLSWTGAERVEGYTDLLWVLLTAAGGRLGFDYLDVALALDRAGMVLAVAIAGLSPRTGRWSAPRLLAGGGLLAASAPLAIWANGGLEQGLMAAVLALVLFLAERAALSAERPWRRLLLPALPFVALALLRADGFLLVALVVAGTTAAAPRAARRVALLAVPALGALAAQELFRLIYYGEWQPNSAVVKLALTRERLAEGINYVRLAFASHVVLLAAAAIAAGVLVSRRAFVSVLAPGAVIVGWTVYTALVGGDIFPGWRPFVFVLVAVAWLLAELAERLSTRLPAALAVSAAACALAGVHYHSRAGDDRDRGAKDERWEWDGLAIGATLKRAFGERQPLLAVDAAGGQPYASELPCLDMLGLNDFYIAHHRPPGFGHRAGVIGHDLGDGAYVLGRAPDLISFHLGETHEPVFLSGRQMVSLPEFRDRYQWIRLRAAGADGRTIQSELWVRREGGKVGVSRSADRIEAPGYLFTGEASPAVAALDARGTMVAEVTGDRPGVLPGLEIPAGRWRVDAEAAASGGGGPLAVAVRCAGRSMQRLRPPASPRMIVVEGPLRADLVIAPAIDAPGAALVERVVLTRVPELQPTRRCGEAGQPLTATLDELSATSRPGRYWAHPDNLLPGPEGVVVVVDRRRRAARIVLAADNNDSYRIDIARGGRSIWHGDAPPFAGWGLAARTLALPPRTVLEPGDRVAVRPRGGDGLYSVGAMTIVP